MDRWIKWVLIYDKGSPKNSVNQGRHQSLDHRVRSTLEVEADKAWERADLKVYQCDLMLFEFKRMSGDHVTTIDLME